MIIRICEECSKEFKTHACYLKRGGGRYCSRKCCDKPSICIVEGCEQKVQGNGYCAKHYMRLRLHGTLNIECIGQSRPGKRNGMYGSDRRGENSTFFGKKHTKEAKDKQSKDKKGIPLSEQHRRNIKENTPRGDKCHTWKGGITPINILIRGSSEYKEWRKLVFRRDGYKCVICGDKKGGNIHADHIKPFSLYPELRLDISNGRTLCKSCHEKHGWNYFKDKKLKTA